MSGSAIGSRRVRRQVFQNHIPANAIEKCAQFRCIPNGLALLGPQKTQQAFLHDVVHIRAAIPHVIKNLVAKFQAQTLKVGIDRLHSLDWGLNGNYRDPLHRTDRCRLNPCARLRQSLSRSPRRALLLETLAAINGPSLCRLERKGSFPAAMGTNGRRLDAARRPARSEDPL